MGIGTISASVTDNCNGPRHPTKKQINLMKNMACTISYHILQKNIMDVHNIINMQNASDRAFRLASVDAPHAMLGEIGRYLE